MATININVYDRKTALKIPETVNLVIQAKQSETGEKDAQGNKIKAYHPNLMESVYFSAPVISAGEVTENIVGLLPHIVTLLQEAQKGIVKSLILDKGVKSVDSDAITVAKCVQWLDDTNSGKINEDYIKSWFAENLATTARNWIIGFSGWSDMALTDVMNAQLDQKVTVLCECVLAGHKSTVKSPVESRHFKPVLKFDRYLTDGEKDSVWTGIVDKCVAAEKQFEDMANAWG